MLTSSIRGRKTEGPKQLAARSVYVHIRLAEGPSARRTTSKCHTSDALVNLNDKFNGNMNPPSLRCDSTFSKPFLAAGRQLSEMHIDITDPFADLSFDAEAPFPSI